MIYIYLIILSFVVFNFWYYLDDKENYKANFKADIGVLIIFSMVWPFAWLFMIGILLVDLISYLLWN